MSKGLKIATFIGLLVLSFVIVGLWIWLHSSVPGLFGPDEKGQNAGEMNVIFMVPLIVSSGFTVLAGMKAFERET